MIPRFKLIQTDENTFQAIGPNEHIDQHGSGRFQIDPNLLTESTPQEIIEQHWEQETEKSYQRKIKKDKDKTKPEVLLNESKTEIAAKRQKQGMYMLSPVESKIQDDD